MEEERENLVLEDENIQNDAAQDRDLVLEDDTPPDAGHDDAPENIVTWTLTEKMKQKAFFKGYL